MEVVKMMKFTFIKLWGNETKEIIAENIEEAVNELEDTTNWIFNLSAVLLTVFKVKEVTQ
jgi:hypothetical protein